MVTNLVLLSRLAVARCILLCRALHGASYCSFILATHQNASWSFDKAILFTLRTAIRVQVDLNAGLLLLDSQRRGISKVLARRSISMMCLTACTFFDLPAHPFCSSRVEHCWCKKANDWAWTANNAVQIRCCIGDGEPSKANRHASTNNCTVARVCYCSAGSKVQVRS
jgi:hypothetical protein